MTRNKNTIYYDLYRYSGRLTKRAFLKTYFTTPGFNYMVWFRLTKYYNNIFFRFLLKRKMLKFGIEIHPKTKIGRGFYIGHWGGIVINENVIIGTNCNISQGVTIGQINVGKNKGTPTILDNVYIASGAKILGNITIGNNVSIGANSVVVNDAEDNCTVGGIPAKRISSNGSAGYINRVLTYHE